MTKETSKNNLFETRTVFFFINKRHNSNAHSEKLLDCFLKILHILITIFTSDNIFMKKSNKKN